MFGQMKRRRSGDGGAARARWLALSVDHKRNQLAAERAEGWPIWQPLALGNIGIGIGFLYDADLAPLGGMAVFVFVAACAVILDEPKRRRVRWARMEKDIEEQEKGEFETLLFECDVDGATYWVSAYGPFHAAALLGPTYGGLREQSDFDSLSVEQCSESRASTRRFLDEDTGTKQTMWGEFQRDRSPRIIASTEY